jgi:hypothetical protein
METCAWLRRSVFRNQRRRTWGAMVSQCSATSQEALKITQTLYTAVGYTAAGLLPNSLRANVIAVNLQQD